MKKKEEVVSGRFVYAGEGCVMKGLIGRYLHGLHPKKLSYARCLHKMNFSDLLEREVVPLQSAEAQAILRKQVILVTGAAGSIGSELCRQLLDYEPQLVVALDTNETGLFDLAESLRSHAHAAHLYPYIGDIKDVQRMSRFFTEVHPQIVFHAAAYKHVPLLEQYPDQAVQTNALATYHLCQLARRYEVDRFVFISSDKAAAPVSVLGASKRLGELIVQSFAQSMNCSTHFCAVRFGNVIGSRGSVVPIFAKQIEHGGPVTVTDPEASRYFMTIPEACGLVIITSAIAEQGGLYMLDMGNPVRILDLAIKMIRLRGLREGQDIPIVFTGLRPGERLHETLVASDEQRVPTVHEKIFSVVYNYGLPVPSRITQLMLSLDKSLQDETVAQLRERLFEMVRVHELVTTK
jgi:FlaA1/EpsC-like NDP-sugar epimerase